MKLNVGWPVSVTRADAAVLVVAGGSIMTKPSNVNAEDGAIVDNGMGGMTAVDNGLCGMGVDDGVGRVATVDDRKGREGTVDKGIGAELAADSVGVPAVVLFLRFFGGGCCYCLSPF